MKISEIIDAIETIAPLALQESYDNAGIQVGDKSVEASSALLCLDVTEEVIDEAISIGANLIIAHHPLLFKGIKSITGSNYIERILIKAIQNNIVIYASHTNMDNAYNGVNYKIAKIIGLDSLQILDPLQGRLLKLATYVPKKFTESVRNALFNAGAGYIGNYDNCSYTIKGEGTFRAGENAHPFCGEIGQMHKEEEAKIEVIFPDYKKVSVIKALLAIYPYEVRSFYILPLNNSWNHAGSGIIGNLSTETDAIDFLKDVKSKFQVKSIKHSSILDKKIKRVALCGGAGSFLIPKAISLGADIFLTGEIKYHDYFGNNDRIILAELGHYESEQYTKDIFCDIITKKFPTFAVHYTKVETNPINYL